MVQSGIVIYSGYLETRALANENTDHGVWVGAGSVNGEEDNGGLF